MRGISLCAIWSVIYPNLNRGVQRLKVPSLYSQVTTPLISKFYFLPVTNASRMINALIGTNVITEPPGGNTQVGEGVSTGLLAPVERKNGWQPPKRPVWPSRRGSGRSSKAG